MVKFYCNERKTNKETASPNGLERQQLKKRIGTISSLASGLVSLDVEIAASGDFVYFVSREHDHYTWM